MVTTKLFKKVEKKVFLFILVFTDSTFKRLSSNSLIPFSFPSLSFFDKVSIYEGVLESKTASKIEHKKDTNNAIRRYVIRRVIFCTPCKRSLKYAYNRSR